MKSRLAAKIEKSQACAQCALRVWPNKKMKLYFCKHVHSLTHIYKYINTYIHIHIALERRKSVGLIAATHCTDFELPWSNLASCPTISHPAGSHFTFAQRLYTYIIHTYTCIYRQQPPRVEEKKNSLRVNALPMGMRVLILIQMRLLLFSFLLFNPSENFKSSPNIFESSYDLSAYIHPYNTLSFTNSRWGSWSWHDITPVIECWVVRIHLKLSTVNSGCHLSPLFYPSSSFNLFTDILASSSASWHIQDCITIVTVAPEISYNLLNSS